VRWAEGDILQKKQPVSKSGQQHQPYPSIVRSFSCGVRADEVSKILGAQVLTHGIEGDGAALSALTKSLNENREVKRAVINEIRTIQGKACQDFEKINGVFLLWEPFSMGNGLLTQTLKVKRNVVAERFKSEIASLYHHNK